MKHGLIVTRGPWERSTLGEDPFHPKRNRPGIGAIW
jgi:hypothetical protein